ncbi:MAG: hypothetical protein QM692_03160 [Thermomicrobiales bacterium]
MTLQHQQQWMQEFIGSSRRDLLKGVGGALLLASTGLITTSRLSAQEATPLASPETAGSLIDKHAVVRLRAMKQGHSVDELLAMVDEGFVPLMEDIPGLVWYAAAGNDETHAQFAVSVFEDAAGVEASTEQAMAWAKEGAGDLTEGDPTILGGVIGVSAAPAPAEDTKGQYMVVRLREPNPKWEVAEVMRLIDEGYVPLVQEIPEFITYFGLVDPATGRQAFVGVFEDKAGTDASTKAAGEWLTANAYDFFAGDPIVAEGRIGAASSGER